MHVVAMIYLRLEQQATRPAGYGLCRLLNLNCPTARSAATTKLMLDKQLHSWREWYGFARETLGYEPQEATEYANLRYAEELNHAATSERG